MRPKAIQRALMNLASNALRYGETAVVSVAWRDRALAFSVEDDGPGIPAELRGDAVQPFLRLDSARNQDRGSGVGLAWPSPTTSPSGMAAPCAWATARRWAGCAWTCPAALGGCPVAPSAARLPRRSARPSPR
jgi:hypothetical protein